MKIIKEIIDGAKMKLLLGEGIIMTHDIKKVSRFLHSHMSNRWSFFIVEKLGIIEFTPKTENKENDYIIKYMNNMGYFLSNYYKDDEPLGNEYNGNDWTSFSFEAKYDMEYTVNGFYLYHVTDRKYLPKIMKIGLVPKAKNKIGSHPDRIYLATSKKNLKEISTVFFEDGYIEDPVYLRINISGLYNKYLIDPQFPGGVYTTQNIPPKNIEVIK